MTLSPQHFVVVNLVLLALVAYSAASIVGTAVAGRLMPPPRVELSPPPPALAPENPKPTSFYARISRRDIFNPVPEATPAVVESAPAPTQLNLKLIGVAVHRNTASSTCVLEDQKARKQSHYGIDDKVEGTDATVKAVEWDRVILSRPSGEEFLELEKPALAGMAAPIRPMGQPFPGQAAAPTDGAVRMVANNEYVVERTEVDRAFENLSQLFTQVRAVPHFEGGRSTGFRLFAIRQGSIFDRIGLKNGDIIQKINELELTDPGRALSMMQELRSESELTVEVVRNRQPLTLSYRFE